MSARLTDQEIAGLLDMPKRLPADYRSRLRMKLKSGHKEADLDVAGDDGSEFVVKLRQSAKNPLDFSVVLAYHLPNSNQVFRLRRYNGLSHRHTNRLERERFFGYHVHTATERYQELEGVDEEGFAELSSSYADIDSALECMIRECGFVIEGGGHQPLLL